MSGFVIKSYVPEPWFVSSRTSRKVYVYVSNETSNLDVFFDNLQISHTRGAILEETHYYPFGLTMAGISSTAAGGVENKRKYNGIELENDLDIQTYDAFFRELDPQTGRWWQIDPKIENMEQWSPYASNFDNPITYMDALGDEPDGGGPDDPPSTGTRIWGAVKGVGGVIEMAVGAVGGAATSWTGVGAVAGGAVVVHGADVAAAGFTQLWTGKSTQSFTEQGISKGLQVAGVSEQKANIIAGLADATVSIVSSAGVGAATNSSKVVSATTKSASVASTGAKSLQQQAGELVKSNGGKNSVTLRTPTQQIRYDLAGKAHGLVTTPHKQIYNKNIVNGVVKSVTRASKEATVLTQQEIRMIRKYIEKLK